MPPQPRLPKSYKGKFPFPVAATSFIYRDLWSVNADLLGPFVDEIELLLFESLPGSLPDEREIQALCTAAERHGHRYNVHLPVDLALGDDDPTHRRQAVARLEAVMALVAPLAATTHTLHLECPAVIEETRDRSRWLASLAHTMAMLQDRGLSLETISVETLFYPFHWLHPLLDRFPLAVCLDLGHLTRCGRDLWKTYLKYKSKTSIIHLHGVDNKKDHLSLDRMANDPLSSVVRILGQFSGTVSLEVFRYDDLLASLVELERLRPLLSNTGHAPV